MSSASATDQPSAEANSEAAPFQQSVLRTRIIPAFALAMVVGLLGLLAYSVFAPDKGRFTNDCRVQALGYCVYDTAEVAPDFTVETFSGKQVSLGDYQGQIVVLNFWASWCLPCREETPLLETAYKQLGDDVVLLGINVQDSEGDASAFLEQFGVTYESSRTGGDAVSIDYGVTGVPETYVIDAEGRAVAELKGPVTTVDQLQAMVAVAR